MTRKVCRCRCSALAPSADRHFRTLQLGRQTRFFGATLVLAAHGVAGSPADVLSRQTDQSAAMDAGASDDAASPAWPTYLPNGQLDDPQVYTRPWTLGVAIKRDTLEGNEVLEYAGVEGESDVDLMVGIPAAVVEQEAGSEAK